MAKPTSEIHEELRCRRSPSPFIPFAIVMADGTHHLVKRPGQFASREDDMMLIASGGVTRIRLENVSRIEERKPMTDEQEKLRAELVAHLDGTPFKRFAIHMADGATFEIVRRFQAAIGLTKGLVVSADGSVRRNFHLRDLAAITELAVA